MSAGPDNQPSAEERDLIARWQQIQSNPSSVREGDARPGWFRDANLFLRHQEHWFCQRGVITKAMAETLKHYDKPPVQVCPQLTSLTRAHHTSRQQ